MNPKISVLLVSHQKEIFVHTALHSISSQWYPNWSLMLVDSGSLMQPLLHVTKYDERVVVVKSSESADLATTRNPHSWVANGIFANKVFTSSDLFLLLCDDDWFYPWAFQALADFYQEAPGRECMYGHVHLGRSDARGVTSIFGARMADVARGKACNGPKLDCQVDYLQFCFSRVALEKYREKWGPEILSERLEDKGHADGIFMERMGELFPVYAVPAWIGMNRRTPLSVNCGT